MKRQEIGPLRIVMGSENLKRNKKGPKRLDEESEDSEVVSQLNSS